MVDDHVAFLYENDPDWSIKEADNWYLEDGFITVTWAYEGYELWFYAEEMLDRDTVKASLDEKKARKAKEEEERKLAHAKRAKQQALAALKSLEEEYPNLE
jgi:hypothetical protein